MPGEVIVGGRQDRTIAEETILASNGEPAPVDVFCVEHGRWSSRADGENSEVLSALVISDSAASEEQLARLAAETARGKFVASAGSLSKASRLATQSEQDQSKVWLAVAEANAAAGVSTESGAFTANYVGAGNRQRLEPYLKNLERRLAAEPNVIGVVVAINGKIEAVDVFESTPLFQKLWPKLLKSYALDAAVAAAATRHGQQTSVTAARRFLETALTADVKIQSAGGGLVVQQRAARGVTSFSASSPADSAAPTAMGGFAGGFGPVHASAFAH